MFAVYILWKRRQWFTELGALFKDRCFLFILFFCYFFVSLISITVLYPRAHYLLLPGILTIVGISMLVVDKVRQPVSDDFWKITLLGMLLLFVGSYTYGRPVPKKHNLATIGYLTSLGINQEVHLLDALGGIGQYVGKNYHRVVDYHKTQNFNKFLKNNNINMILMSPNLMSDTRFKNDLEWVRFYKDDYAQRGFKKADIPDSDYQLVVAWTLLNKVIFNPLIDTCRGFYPSDNWTKGYAVIPQINYYLTNEDRYLVLHTKGYHPYRNDFEKLELHLYINGNQIEYSHREEKTHFFKLNKADAIINDIRIESSTFVPKRLGINNDTRELGIDVAFIVVK